jgi:hypothetical protein
MAVAEFGSITGEIGTDENVGDNKQKCAIISYAKENPKLT